MCSRNAKGIQRSHTSLGLPRHDGPADSVTLPTMRRRRRRRLPSRPRPLPSASQVGSGLSTTRLASRIASVDVVLCPLQGIERGQRALI